MYIVWIEVNGQEQAFRTATAANRGSAVIQARRAFPDCNITGVVPA